MAEAEKKESSLITMKDVMFMYSSVTREVEQLNTDKKPPVTDHELEFHSYEIKILISEDRFKAELKKKFKGAKNLPNAKEFTPEEVLEKFNIEVEDDVVLVKFSQSCLVGPASKRRASFPITQIGVKGRIQDRDGNAIAQDTALGNGTMGHFQFRPVEGKNGLYLYPQLLCITHLIEYIAVNVEDDESLDLEELDDSEMDTEAKSNEDESMPEGMEGEFIQGSKDKTGDGKEEGFDPDF